MILHTHRKHMSLIELSITVAVVTLIVHSLKCAVRAAVRRVRRIKSKKK